jgi:hypothetical protein
MHDPISALFAKDQAQTLASSALPCAPVVPDERTRRRGAGSIRRRFARRSR